MLFDKCLEMSYKNSPTSDQNIVPNCAIVPNIDRQSNSLLKNTILPMPYRDTVERCPDCFGNLLLPGYVVLMFMAVRSEAQSQCILSGPQNPHI